MAVQSFAQKDIKAKRIENALESLNHQLHQTINLVAEVVVHDTEVAEVLKFLTGVTKADKPSPRKLTTYKDPGFKDRTHLRMAVFAEDVLDVTTK